jgi:N-acyl-D-aspartate/D-glutamate deacylase
VLDLVLKNGRVVDGTENSWFFGDVGINNGVLADIGGSHKEGEWAVDVRGQVVSLGSIDDRCHSDPMILDRPRSEIKLERGVTTGVVSQMTSFPARRFKLDGRGLLAPGFVADLALFDPDAISQKGLTKTQNASQRASPF